jgi:tetratricopeptide (TPR) repeat protein
LPTAASGLLLAFLLARGQQPAEAAPSLLARANAALETRRFSEAVRIFGQAVAEQPGSAEALYGLGKAYWGPDRLFPISADKAIDAHQKALTLVADEDTGLETRILEALVLVYLRSERVSEARSIFVRLLEREMRPDRIAYIKTQIAEIDLDLGVLEPDELTIVNAQGDILGPIGPNYMRTNRYFEKGRHTRDPVREEKWYRLAARADPMMYQAHNNLGVALAHQGRYEEAILHLRRADVVWRMKYPKHPLYLHAHAWLLFCYLELGQLDLARAEGLIIGEIEKKDEDLFAFLYGARLRIALGGAQEVVGSLEEASRRDPENVEVLHALASAYAGLGRFADAARSLRAALEAIPEECPYFQARAPRWRLDLEAWSRKAELDRHAAETALEPE